MNPNELAIVLEAKEHRREKISLRGTKFFYRYNTLLGSGRSYRFQNPPYIAVIELKKSMEVVARTR